VQCSAEGGIGAALLGRVPRTIRYDGTCIIIVIRDIPNLEALRKRLGFTFTMFYNLIEQNEKRERKKKTISYYARRR